MAIAGVDPTCRLNDADRDISVGLSMQRSLVFCQSLAIWDLVNLGGLFEVRC